MFLLGVLVGAIVTLLFLCCVALGGDKNDKN